MRAAAKDALAGLPAEAAVAKEECHQTWAAEAAAAAGAEEAGARAGGAEAEAAADPEEPARKRWE